jgi:hypothetical protein
MYQQVEPVEWIIGKEPRHSRKGATGSSTSTSNPLATFARVEPPRAQAPARHRILPNQTYSPTPPECKQARSSHVIAFLMDCIFLDRSSHIRSPLHLIAHNEATNNLLGKSLFSLFNLIESNQFIGQFKTIMRDCY